MKEVSVAMVGMGGYARFYGSRLLRSASEHGARFVGGVSRSPQNVQQEYKDAGIPMYASLEALYRDVCPDLVVVSSPHHLHAPVTCQALSRGSSVLCEKPVAATIQEAQAMAAADEKSPGFVGIGYQWSFTDAIQALKRDVLAGVLGRPVRLKTLVFWPRAVSYYHRNDWAAKLKSADGRWILDSPVQNATAHYLHNMLYVLGDSREKSAQPADVQAELYRANVIENYDAAALRCHTDQGTEILFYTSHCVPLNRDPILVYEFENAIVEYDGNDGRRFIARFHDGHTQDYGNPADTIANKLWLSVDAVRTGAPLACGIQTSLPHTLCANGAQESSEIMDFPKELVRQRPGNDPLLWVDGLQEVFEHCYEQGILPSEVGNISWANKGQRVDLWNYHTFPSRADS